MEYSVRPMREEEYHLLGDFLYEAIFIPKGAVPQLSQLYSPK